MATIKILPVERKFVRMLSFVDKIINSDLEKTIDDMIQKDTRLLCRLNFKNPEVLRILNEKIAKGLINALDLIHDPEETRELSGISRTEYDNTRLTPEDAEWLESLTERFRRRTVAQAKADRKKRQLDESHDGLLALV